MNYFDNLVKPCIISVIICLHISYINDVTVTGRCIVDAKNAKGETALMKAAFYDYNEMAKIMLTEGKFTFRPFVLFIYLINFHNIKIS